MKSISFNNTHIPKVLGVISNHDVFGELGTGSTAVFAGKTALALLLKYFRSSGALENKTAEMLVPPWMGNWVYMTMQKYSFPTREFNPRVRGILAYHQWGFPQRMEDILQFAKQNNLFVIEDCAHAFESYYNGARVGTFGDAAIFSLAKFFPSVVGGAVYSAQPMIQSFMRSEVSKIPSHLEKEAFAGRVRYDRNPSLKHTIELEKQYAIYDRLRACHPRALTFAAHSIRHGALKRRREHVLRLQKEFDSKNRYGLFEEGVTPWVFPIFFDTEKMHRAARDLQTVGIESGVFHFDINRNMLNPEYRECLAVPCHDGISDEEMDLLIRIIRTHA